MSRRKSQVWPWDGKEAEECLSALGKAELRAAWAVLVTSSMLSITPGVEEMAIETLGDMCGAPKERALPMLREIAAITERLQVREHGSSLARQVFGLVRFRVNEERVTVVVPWLQKECERRSKNLKLKRGCK